LIGSLHSLFSLCCIDYLIVCTGPPEGTISKSDYAGILESWSESSYKPDFTVAQDGSGTHGTIQAAVNALAAMGHNRPARAVIHVKSGVYHEKVEIGQKLHNVMLVGDGIDKTIVTGNRNVVQGSTTLNSATFGKTMKILSNDLTKQNKNLIRIDIANVF